MLILCGLLAGLLLAEVALRLAGYSYPVFYMPDTERGYALRPAMEGWYRKENEVYIRINSDGLRDREHSRAKPAGTLRIAVIGDSYPEALQVPMENAFWYVMEQKLQGCAAFAGQKVEVINFGVSGYGTAQELITLRKHVWQYEPDIVLLAMTTNNDISDNVLALKRTNQIPYFVYRDGQLVLDDSFLRTRSFRLQQSFLGRAGAWVRDHSRVIQAIHQGQTALKYYLAARRERARTQTAAALEAVPTEQKNAVNDAPAAEPGADIQVYREPSNEVWNNAWRVTEGLISMMRDDVRQHGAKLVVITLSNGIQVFPGPDGRQAFMRGLGVADLFYPDRRIKSFCEREGIPVITLAPALQAYADEHVVYLHGFGKDTGNGHWNQLGHRVAGEMMAQQLCEGKAK
ncbi:MAG TPA: SGNH/GDSL hydrolase family protein [Pyrinomonadaceae bacterium]